MTAWLQSFEGIQKAGTLREESVTRMDGIDLNLFRERNDRRNVQITTKAHQPETIPEPASFAFVAPFPCDPMLRLPLGSVNCRRPRSFRSGTQPITFIK